MEGDQKNPRWTALRCVTNRQVKNRGTDPFKFFSPKLAFDDGSVEGSHTYALPFAQCPDCGLKGAAGGLEYPWIDGKSVYDSKILRHLVWDKSGESTWADRAAADGRAG